MRSKVPKLSLRQPRQNPLVTMAATRRISLKNLPPEFRQKIEAALEKAEVGLCNYNGAIYVSEDLTTDFRIQDHAITLSPRVFRSMPLLRLQLRHAMELSLWLQICPSRLSDEKSIPVFLLAALTATKFFLQMPISERQEIENDVPEWLKESAEAAERFCDKEVLQTIATHLGLLFPLLGAKFSEGLPVQSGIDVAIQFSAIANPTELILTQQGDERLLIDPATGLNKYGCSPRPRPEAITFSSCTASSVSEYAYREAETLRHRLMAELPSGNPVSRYECEIESVRNSLREVLDLKSPETEIILTSSGTDAELYPLVLFRSPGKKLVNIIVAPDEVGSGTVVAAGGRHFSAHSPLGKSLRASDSVEGIGAEFIEVVCIPIRKDGGSSVAHAELKQHISATICEAAKSADTIILHVVDNTKTGIVAPDTGFVLQLKETYGSKLHVVVDACQFRLEKSNLHRYLAHGFSVLITGSKFFTGPPFCGALLVPKEMQRESSEPFPKGFADYFTRSEVPPSLKSRAQHFSPELNLGLLFRWVGALNEMKYFYSVNSAQRTEILKTFRSALIDSIAANADLRLLPCPVPHRWENADMSLWDALPTIFSFAVRDPNSAGEKWLPIRDLKKIYYLLNRDCSGHLPRNASGDERKLAARKCHIGQPVTTSRNAEYGESGALRIACGARLVYGITYEETLGRNPQERFERELTDAQTVLAKVSLIVRYWPHFSANAPS